jgi:hypothetical protein
LPFTEPMLDGEYSPLVAFKGATWSILLACILNNSNN